MHMDQKSQEIFDAILKKNPEELNQNEIIFLRARSGYLKKVQLEEYKDVLETKPPIQETVKSNAKTK